MHSIQNWKCIQNPKVSKSSTEESISESEHHPNLEGGQQTLTGTRDPVKRVWTALGGREDDACLCAGLYGCICPGSCDWPPQPATCTPRWQNQVCCFSALALGTPGKKKKKLDYLQFGNCLVGFRIFVLCPRARFIDWSTPISEGFRSGG